MSSRINYFLFIVVLCVAAGCANITSPNGGRIDKRPPRLVVVSPKDSLLNAYPKRIELQFDEYINVTDATKEVQISPILSIPPSVMGMNKHVIVRIVDTLLEENTTYRLSFGSAVKDVHEGNAFSRYTYTFSTGSYFDSLVLKGRVINAVTGLPDSGITVTLYGEKENDTAISRHKPKYTTKIDNKGEFIFKGLPKRNFRIYAIKDVNSNLTYDGPVPGEWIGFTDKPVTAGDTAQAPIVLKVFPEIPDTGAHKGMDSVRKGKPSMQKTRQNTSAKDSTFSYSVNVDTSNVENRSFDINTFIKLTFSKPPVLNKDKIKLTYDSAETTITSEVVMEIDSLHSKELYIKTNWSQNTVYTLKLAKGFAKDTSGREVMPSRHTFRTKNEDDYGKVKVHLPMKYYNGDKLLLVTSETDTIYNKPVKDTIINLVRVRPAKYTLRIIVDKNGNGKWDTGDLLGNIQPEEVIPYQESLPVKPGWDNTIDFEQKPKPKANMKGKADKR